MSINLSIVLIAFLLCSCFNLLPKIAHTVRQLCPKQLARKYSADVSI